MLKEKSDGDPHFKLIMLNNIKQVYYNIRVYEVVIFLRNTKETTN
jgi:hypothetical protein